MIGVLALQGAFEAHARSLAALGHEVTFVRSARALEACDGLVLPGGESTVHLKLLERERLVAPLAWYVASGRPVLATCAGLILAALTVERLNPAVYTCAELNNEEYSPHLKMANVNDYVVTGEHNAFLLAQAALNCGMTAVFSELLTHRYGNSFYRCDVPPAWVGRTFFDLLVHVKQKHEAILIGVRAPGQPMRVNPPSHTFAAGDQVVLIALKNVEL